MKAFSTLRNASLLAAVIAVLALAGSPLALAAPPDPPNVGETPSKGKGQGDDGIDLSDGQNDLFAHTGQESSPPDGTDAQLPPCQADLTADRLVDADDLMEVILHWGETSSTGPLTADADRDGVVGVGDLIEVVIHWGICP